VLVAGPVRGQCSEATRQTSRGSLVRWFAPPVSGPRVKMEQRGTLGTGEASKRVEERSKGFEGLVAGHRGSPRLPARPPGVAEIGEDVASPHGLQAVWPHGNVWFGSAVAQTITVSVGGGNPGEESRIDAREQRVAGRSPAIDRSPGMTFTCRATGRGEVVWRYKVEMSASADRSPRMPRCSAGEWHIGVSLGLSVPGGASRLFTIGAGLRPRQRRGAMPWRGLGARAPGLGSAYVQAWRVRYSAGRGCGSHDAGTGHSIRARNSARKGLLVTPVRRGSLDTDTRRRKVPPSTEPCGRIEPDSVCAPSGSRCGGWIEEFQLVRRFRNGKAQESYGCDVPATGCAHCGCLHGATP
jgi:hypothetical protein